ncbi:hypothetical protein Snoj_12230 [Streptomyces nojiriensis]|uniref:Uncharacterized protein n=1 Tax=Streptomyces nojiriensis TaxID=66374 RepID=A0ABQ3SHF1_9ACTN|nr:hypothetical protein GCM10010205_42050 [Streptomyces nojiriensis]GHI67305.1 hypothetical protein Snoj_12230 [Streptomyces nojiriensis]
MRSHPTARLPTVSSRYQHPEAEARHPNSPPQAPGRRPHGGETARLAMASGACVQVSPAWRRITARISGRNPADPLLLLSMSPRETGADHLVRVAEWQTR